MNSKNARVQAPKPALEFDESRDGISALWIELGWAVAGSREWCLHPHVFFLAVCLCAVSLEQSLRPDDSRDGLPARWADMGWDAAGSREWRLHPHVFLRVVCLFVVILGCASEACSGNW